MTSFGGVLPALITPLDDEGRLHRTSLERLLRRLYAAGVHGVYICGSTGEGMLQSVTQREQIAELAVENSPPEKQVIVHVGAASTSDAIRLARHAARAGAYAVSSLPPPVGSYSFAEIKAYYLALAEASALPLFVYFFPEITPQISSPEQIAELCAIPNVAGLKYTSYDLYAMSRLKQQGALVYYGRDEMLSAGLLYGADGAIGSFYNVIPESCLRMWQLAQAGEWEQTRALQQQINEVISIVTSYPFLPALKKILDWTGIPCGPCVAPRRAALTDAEATRLREDLRHAKLEEVLSAE